MVKKSTLLLKRMRKISQWQIRMQTMVPSLARSDRLSVFQLYALPANATRQWYFENCFQGRTNLPNANKMQKKIILILSVGELVSAQMLSILSPTLFTRLVESNIWDFEIELCAKVSGIAGWQTLQVAVRKFMAEGCFKVQKRSILERDRCFSAAYLSWMD